MIHLIDDYYASVDSNCYTLLRENGVDKKGKKKYITLGYCGSLLETLKLLQRKVLRSVSKMARSSLHKRWQPSVSRRTELRGL
jgi:hypothetical protein